MKPLRGVFHCFGGSTPQLQLILTMGYYVGFDGNITYSKDWGKIVAAAPLSRIVLETDAPFLPPQTQRGKTNEPAFIVETAQELARVLGISNQECENVTTANAERIFHLR